MSTVNKERVELWVAALESDSYKKCTSHLRVQIPSGAWGSGFAKHCALGVAIEVAGLNGCQIDFTDFIGNTALPDHVVDWYGFDCTDPEIRDSESGLVTSIIGLNDEDERSFWGIAQAVRENYLKDH